MWTRFVTAIRWFSLAKGGRLLVFAPTGSDNPGQDVDPGAPEEHEDRLAGWPLISDPEDSASVPLGLPQSHYSYTCHHEPQGKAPGLAPSAVKGFCFPRISTSLGNNKRTLACAVSTVNASAVAAVTRALCGSLFCARCLICWPASRPGAVSTGEWPFSRLPCHTSYYNIIRRMTICESHSRDIC